MLNLPGGFLVLLTIVMEIRPQFRFFKPYRIYYLPVILLTKLINYVLHVAARISKKIASNYNRSLPKCAISLEFALPESAPLK